jgi:putative DNA primase/helicase
MSSLADELLRVVEPRTSPQSKRKTERASDGLTKAVDDHDEARRFVSAQLDTTKEGYIRGTITNLTRILSTDPAWAKVIAYDSFRDAVSKSANAPCIAHEAPISREAGAWSDDDVTRTASWCSYVYGTTFTNELVERAVAVIAHRNPRHEVRDWLNSLRHDGMPRLNALTVRYLGADDTPYNRRVGEILLISAIARIKRPGCKVDTVPVLEGPQGARKSTAIKALFGAWCSDSAVEIGNKDAYQLLRGAWAIEFAEVDKYRGRDAAVLKSFISSPVDRYRPSYGRRTVDIPRQCVFVGTTNEVEYLGDATGGRRWLPVRVGEIDIEALRRDREQLFAEALAAYEAGATWHPDSDSFVLEANHQQAMHSMPDPWLQPIESYVLATVNLERSRTKGWTIAEVLLHALDKSAGVMTRADQMRVAAIMRELGFTATRPRNGEAPTRVRTYRLDRLDQGGSRA